MANKENLAPLTPGRGDVRAEDQYTPPGSGSGTLGLRPWQTSAFTSPPFRALSPNSKPALSQQRDHSGCGRSASPLKVRKTRENLRQDSLYPDIPPPCLHTLPGHCDVSILSQAPTVQDSRTRGGYESRERALSRKDGSVVFDIAGHGAENFPTVLPLAPLPQPAPRIQRHKSASRRMLSKVKQGISNRTKAAAIRPVESETGLLRRISARGKQTVESERRAQSFEVSRTSVDSNGEDVGEGVLAAAYPQPWRSLTDSTVSTDEILGSAPTTPPPKPASVRSASDFSSAISQTLDCSQPELTPRPPIKALPCPPDGDCKPIALAIPYVELAVNLDRLAVDAGSAPEMWVAIQGVVHSKTLQLDGKHFEHIKHAPDRAATDHSTIIGAITSLRLCFKPAEGCHITDLVGQKTAKNLNVDQSCVLFIKLRVPVLKSRAIYEPDADNALLFDELESIVGTLETDLLNVEARYRHSLLTPDNVINVRHTAKLRRPKIESRWSLLTSPEDLSISDEVHTKLAIHLADHYPPERALGLIDRCLSVERLASEAVRQIRQCVLDDLHKHKHHPAESADKPSVVVTDIDTLDSELGSGTRFEMLPTASDVPLDLPPSKHRAVPMPEALATPPTEVKRRSTSLSALTTLQPHAYTHRTATPKVLSATCLPSLSETPQPLQQPCQSPCQPQPQDSARKLWRHIRHSSLSTQQAADLAASPVHHLEANDTQLRELRRQALANKRSVGAETLRDWKWEERKVQRAEAPWL